MSGTGLKGAKMKESETILFEALQLIEAKGWTVDNFGNKWRVLVGNCDCIGKGWTLTGAVVDALANYKIMAERADNEFKK